MTVDWSFMGSDLILRDLGADQTVFALTNQQLYGHPEVDLGQTDSAVLTAGDPEPENIRHIAHRFPFEFGINASTALELAETMGELRAAFNPLNGACRFIATRSDGTMRELRAYYESGMNLQAVRASNSDYATVSATFYAPDPYWHDTVRPPFINETGIPVLTGTSRAFVETFVIAGDAQTFPKWTFSGPFSGFSAHNLTTGRVFAYTHPTTLTSNADQVVVETLEQSQSVVYLRSTHPDSGSSLLRYLDPFDRDLWPFRPGENTIEIRLDDATAQTAIRGEYTTRWLGC